MKFIGYCLVIMAGLVLGRNGFGLDTWQYWAVALGFLAGEFLVLECDY